MHGRGVLLVSALLLFLGACAPKPIAAPSEEGGTTAISTLPVGPTDPAPSPGGRDLEAIALCALISNAEVADLMGAQAARDDLVGVADPDCTYQITPDGGSTVQNVFVYLYASDLAEVSLGLMRDGGAAQVDGLGSVSYVLFDAASGQYQLVGIRSGDFGFEILSPSQDGAERLAQLILERLPADG